MDKLSVKSTFGSLKQTAGFTLLELMIVLAIVGIMAAIAGPSFQSAIRGSSIVSERDALASAIKMARGEAIYRKQPATVCASTDQATCSGGPDWEQGWIIFRDVAADGAFDGGTDTLIDVHYGNDNVRVGTDGTNGTLTFAATGMRAVAGQQVIGICDSDTSSSLVGSAMQISTVGGIRFQGAPGC